MDIKSKFRGFVFFWEGIKAAKKEMWISLEVLVALTIVISFFIQIVEHAAQPDVYVHWYDSTIWTFESYLGNPGNFAPGDPITYVGRVLWVFVSIINLALFAIPAGLVAKGFTEASENDQRERHLVETRGRLTRVFKRDTSVTFINFCNNLPVDDPLSGKRIYFVPRYLALVPLQVKLGLTMDDIMDTVVRFPEFRLKNQASAQSVEDRAEDRIVVDHFPVNRNYGCYINRGSRITIVSTVGAEEVATGWYAFYMAKLGGFNYVGKDIDVDIEERDNFYKMTDEVRVNYKTREQLKAMHADASVFDRLDRKEQLREDFMQDLLQCSQTDDSWVFVIHTRLKNSANKNDICFSYSSVDGTGVTIHNMDALGKLMDDFVSTFFSEYNLQAAHSDRYAFLDGYLPYRLQARRCKANIVALGVAGSLVHFDVRRYNIMYTITELIRRNLSPSSTILPKDLEDLQMDGYGYQENTVKID